MWFRLIGIMAFTLTFTGCATEVYVDNKIMMLRQTQLKARKERQKLASDVARLKEQMNKCLQTSDTLDMHIRRIVSDYKLLKTRVDQIDPRSFSKILSEDRQLILNMWEAKRKEIEETEQRLSISLAEIQEVALAFERLLRAQHDEMTAFLAKYDQLYGQGSEYQRRKKAREVFSKALILHAQGIQNGDMNKLQEACMRYKEGLLLKPGDIQMKINLVKCLIARGDADDALKLLCELRGASELSREQKTEVEGMLAALSASRARTNAFVKK